MDTNENGSILVSTTLCTTFAHLGLRVGVGVKSTYPNCKPAAGALVDVSQVRLRFVIYC